MRRKIMNQNYMVMADIDIAGVPFCLQYQYENKENILAFLWKRDGVQKMGLSALSDVVRETPFGFEIPKQITELDIVLTSVLVCYNFTTHSFTFHMEAEHYGSFTVSYEKKELQSIWNFILKLQAKFFLSSLPVFGSSFGKEDYVALLEFSLRLEGSDACNDTVVEPGVKLIWKLGGMEIPLSIPEPAGKDSQLAAAQPQPRYVDINKEFGAFRLSRVGFAMGDCEVILYVDAGIRLSVLLLEFIGLYLSVPLGAGRKVDYGMQGAALSVSKPPLSISGGLVLSQNAGMNLFTGEVAVQFRDIGVTALCSYGEFEDKEVSLFAFMMVSANLGGPPVFYITGLAGGFGYNRSIVLPDKVQDTEHFPFVAAALGKGDLKKGMTPAEVLTKMNQVILPEQNQYFCSVGIRFRSFGMIESFLLCNVEFGGHFLISLLGVSEIIFPIASPNPMAAVRLALKAVIAPENGEVSIEGALLDGSYVFHKNCRINGGFACNIWFGKHEHAGDFVITLGGYKSGYCVQHYPKVDRLSVNWRMDDHLSLTAEAYFAVTPACIMMGGNLAIVYENGRLKAWFKAWAEFFMQWDPFMYDISIGISIGASFRWDFFPFYKTFKIELGADLNLWGPPFGGKVHVSWFIISFTIQFGADKPQGQELEWTAFSEKFLSEKNREETITEEAGGNSVIRVQTVNGLVRSGEKTGVALLNADNMELAVTSQVTSSKLCYNSDTPMAEYKGKLGVVPMGVTDLKSKLIVQLTDEKGQFVPEIHAEPIYTNVPKALWNCCKPGKEETDSLLLGVPTGIRLVCVENGPKGVLPEKGSYDMETLCANEKLGPHKFAYEKPDYISGHAYSDRDILKQVEESIGIMGGSRKPLLQELSDIFDVRTEEELVLGGFTKDLDKQLRAEPILAVIGANE